MNGVVEDLLFFLGDKHAAEQTSDQSCHFSLSYVGGVGFKNSLMAHLILKRFRENTKRVSDLNELVRIFVSPPQSLFKDGLCT